MSDINSNCIDLEQLKRSIAAASEWLKCSQHANGHWVGFLKTNSAIEAEWILAQHILGITDDPKYHQVVRTILNEQREDGSWEVYYQAPAGDISVTVECYAALRASGVEPNTDRMIQAREWIFSHGGLSKVRVFTKFWLALLGEWPWEATPNLPPEIIFLPSWFPINLYKFGSWGRATIVALCLATANRISHPLPDNQRLNELFPEGRKAMNYALPKPHTPWGWFFYYADKVLGLYAHSPLKPLRKQALQLCAEWIIKRQEADGCWAGIQPPWIYALVGLHEQGYALNHPVVAAGLKAFNEPWAFSNEKGTYLQCCTSPVWDTVLSLVALADCGFDAREEMVQKALSYTVNEQIHTGGDWQVYVPNVEPAGWAFEYENDTYPDVDDSAVAVLAMAKMYRGCRNPEKVSAAIHSGMKWLLAMRSDNGAWGAFDKNNTSFVVSQIPFSDFGETIDPPSADVTSHVIEAMGYLGQNISNSQIVAQAVDYLRQEQEEDGSWFGRWGVNYIYGTGLVLPSLQAVGLDMHQDWILKAANWLVSKQNEDGGWGESCASYMDPSQHGVGPTTPSQTGWALMGLLALENHDYDASIAKGINYLIQTQKEGTWEQLAYTGTGFPGYGLGAKTDVTKQATLDQGKELGRGFMLNYAMYRHYFPMMALGRAQRFYAKQ